MPRPTILMMRLRRISTLLCPDALQQYPPPHDITVLLGDFNATVRDDVGLWRGTVGPVSPDPLNDNGIRLLELCRSHDLYIANTYFQRKTIHQYTWYSNDGRTKKMIDYVIIPNAGDHW